MSRFMAVLLAAGVFYGLCVLNSDGDWIRGLILFGLVIVAFGVLSAVGVLVAWLWWVGGGR